MSTKTAISDTQRLTILKHLAGGKPLSVVATILNLGDDAVREVARHYGYPDTKKLAWAADIVAKKIDDADRALPESTTPTAPRPAPVAARPTPPPPETPLTRPDEIRVLINTGKGHDSKRIQAAADKVLDAVDRLRTLIDEDQAKHAERRARDAEKAAARAEIERLEKQLAAAKAKLRGGSAPKAPTGLVTSEDLAALGVTSKQVRAWANEHDVDCPTSGRLPSRVLDAWRAAHPATERSAS